MNIVVTTKCMTGGQVDGEDVRIPTVKYDSDFYFIPAYFV